MENANTLWARAFLDELARAGVRSVCVAPGSRSSPLVLAAVADGRFRMVPVLDERSAGFLALGVGKATGRPAAVITTSGTAGANLYPAVIEASHGEVPLLLLTADRPHRLRDSDANQAMDQVRLFGTFPRAFFEVAPPCVGAAEMKHLRGQACRAVAMAVGPPPGPVHLNFPFDKPLEPRDFSVAGTAEMGAREDGSRETAAGSPAPEGLALRGRPDGAPFVKVAGPRETVDPGAMDRLKASLARSRRGLIVAGPVPDPREVGPAVRALAAATGFPLLADPLSGARFGLPGGAHAVSAYDLFLRSPRARRTLRPDLILRVGASPTSVGLLELFREQEGVPQMVVDGGHRWKDHSASAHEYLHGSPLEVFRALVGTDCGPGNPDWNAAWQELEDRARAVLDAHPRDPGMEGWIMEAVADALPAGANLLVGNSMPIRDLDAFGKPRPAPLTVFGNRGTSGIDGLVSTTAGIALASEAPTLGVLGDLAALHDLNGFLPVMQEGIGAGFLVVNNDGGGIFHTLPVHAFEPAFTRFFATPHGLDFRKAADLHGIPYRRVDSLEALRAALSGLSAEGSPFLMEIRTDREEGHARRREILSSVVDAVDGLLVRPAAASPVAKNP